MRKNELGDFADLHHVPRPHKKQKKHQRGFSEDVADKRRARVSFKSYLREIEEEDGELAEGTRPLTDADKDKLITDFTEWSGGFGPTESEESDLRTYAVSGAPAYLDSQDVLDYLLSLSDNVEK